jgi:hypothetical protein
MKFHMYTKQTAKKTQFNFVLNGIIHYFFSFMQKTTRGRMMIQFICRFDLCVGKTFVWDGIEEGKYKQSEKSERVDEWWRMKLINDICGGISLKFNWIISSLEKVGLLRVFLFTHNLSVLLFLLRFFCILCLAD